MLCQLTLASAAIVFKHRLAKKHRLKKIRLMTREHNSFVVTPSALFKKKKPGELMMSSQIDNRKATQI